MGRSVIAVLAGLASAFALFVIVAGLNGGKATAQSEGSLVAANDGFRLAEPAAGVVRGSLNRSSTLQATFQGKLANQRGDKVSVARVVAGDLTINARKNPRTQAGAWGGSGKRITAEEKRTLSALCLELQRSFGPLGTTMPPEEDLLVRSTCYFAEAPVGYKLTDKTVQATRAVQDDATSPVPIGADAQFSNASYRKDLMDVVTDMPTREECAKAETSGDFVSVRMQQACQAEGESGIRYLECRYRSYNLYYDTVRLCYGFRGNVPTGPCTKRCHGKCGAGCIFTRRGPYTRDCAEHDDCIADHDGSGGNYNDSNCGDEFGDADDDFFRARDNCRGC